MSRMNASHRLSRAAIFVASVLFAIAQALLERVVTLAPDEPSVRNNLAAALEMQGQTEQACAMLKE